MKNFIILIIVFLSILIINCGDNKKVTEKKESEFSLPHIEKKAKQGNMVAQYDLGHMYYTGKEVRRDYKKAFFWFEKSAKQGDKKAQNKIGFLYNKGKGVKLDHKKSLYWYKKSAIQGYNPAQYNLGNSYYYAKGVKVDNKKAFYWYGKSAKQGDKKAQNKIGYMYQNGKGTAFNSNKAFFWYKKAAKQGHKTAQYNLGLLYDSGHVISTDYKKAFFWYEKSAIQGHKIAQKKLGFMYYYGIGITQNHKKAKHWYEKAAKQDNKSAQYYLGLMYYFGEEVLKDHQKAFYWLEKSAKQGYIEAQKKLGNMYRYGYGVLKDIKKAAYWDQKGNNGEKKKVSKTLSKKDLNFKNDNAAVYYSKAADILELPTYEKKKDIKMMIKNILQNGWKGKNNELRDILEQNKQSLLLLKRGFLLEKCDFNFGKKFKYLSSKKAPPLTKLLYLSNLCLLEGKYYEKINSDKKAVDLYLSICRLASHISQDSLTISKSISLTIANESYLTLTGYLKSKNVKKNEVRKILNYLEKYKKNHFLVKEVIEYEKKDCISIMEMLAEEQRLEKRPELAKEIILISKKLVERYYGNFAKAFDTNNDADWKFAKNDFDRFVESESSGFTHAKDILEMYFNKENKKIKENIKIAARKVASISFMITGVTFFKLIFNKYQSSIKELNKVISLAKTLTEEN